MAQQYGDGKVLGGPPPAQPAVAQGMVPVVATYVTATTTVSGAEESPYGKCVVRRVPITVAIF